MNDRRRVGVPWYLWRWRLGLIAPMLLFGWLAVSAMRESGFRSAWSVVLAVVFLGFAGLFARLVWRERLR